MRAERFQPETTHGENLRDAALEYHRLPTPGKISVTPTKAMATQRDLALAYSPGVAEACMAIAEDPLQAGELTSRSNLVAVVTNGTAVLGLGNIGAAGRQAGDGGQGLPVQEVRRHRRVRHRAGRERPRRADRDDRAHGADLRRHQPRGHQGARVLLHREEAARAHEDPGVPRRPARHRDRRRRGDPQRPAACRQGHRRGQARRFRRRRGRAGLPGPDRQPRPEAARTSSSPTPRAWSTSAAPKAWTTTRRATPSRPTRARWPT